jgi:hypothetical protein
MLWIDFVHRMRLGFRFVAGVAVVSHVLATVGSAWFHNHAHCHDAFGNCMAGIPQDCAREATGRSHAGQVHRHGHHHGHSHAHHHGHGGGANEGGRQDQQAPLPAKAPLHDDGCAACQFIAQKSVGAEAPPAVAKSDLAADVAPIIGSLYVAARVASPEPRGPPCTS